MQLDNYEVMQLIYVLKMMMETEQTSSKSINLHPEVHEIGF